VNVLVFVVRVVLALFACNIVLAKENAGNLCAENEKEVASCLLEGPEPKVMSFCADRLGVTSYYLRVNKKIEKDIKFSSQRQLYRWQDSDTYVTFLGFDQDGYSYVLGVPQETLGAKAFWLTKRSGEPLDFNAPEFCTHNSFGDKDIVNGTIMDIEDRIVRDNKFLFPPIEGTEHKSPKP